MIDQLFLALGQISVVLVLGFLAYTIKIFIKRRASNHPSFFHYIGIQFSKHQFDKRFWIIFLILIIYAIVNTIFLFNYSIEFQNFSLNEKSPYFKILKTGFTYQTFVLGIIYCFLQSGGTEELLFRGLIAKRLFTQFGTNKGNIIQAFIFYLIHLLIFRLVTGQWISYLQVFVFINSFFIGLMLGYVNFRKKGEGIIPSWILHSSINFTTFLTFAYLFIFLEFQS